MLTKEERARISRENGAKSKGPFTPEGKEKSARNAIQHGLRATKLKHFAPPHYAALANEERREFYQLLDDMAGVYQPVNSVAAAIVRDIAVARWQMMRLDTCITTEWNLALIEGAQHPLELSPELGEMELMSRSVQSVYGNSGAVSKLNREIDRLVKRIANLQRQLRDIHRHFPYGPPPKRTQPDPPQPIENTEAAAENTEEIEQPIRITENTPEVIAYYKKLYPNREIIVLPPDDVAKGIDVEDDMPDIPRIHT